MEMCSHVKYEDNDPEKQVVAPWASVENCCHQALFVMVMIVGASGEAGPCKKPYSLTSN